MAKVTLPELGEDVKSAVVSYWHFEVGDEVNEGDDFVEIATDKATFNVPCPKAGTLVQVVTGDGAKVNVGDVMAVLETAD